MVDIQRMAVVLISRGRRFLGGHPPVWAVTLEHKIDTLTRKVNLMALDTTVLNRILAGAGAATEALRSSLDREKALQAKLDSVSGELASERAAELAEDEADAKANAEAARVADALDALLKGPETPTVEVPAPEEAPAVIEGTQEPVVLDEGPVNPEPVSSETTPDENVNG